MNRNYYKLGNVHILSQTLVLHHRKPIATIAVVAAAATTAVASVTKIILSDATIGITIIEMKTNAALKSS